nr:hypothetical protein [Tanacetum cinerariifolium]
MMHPDILHGQMRKKHRCVKVEFTYPKIVEFVTRGRVLDFGARLQESGASEEDYYARALLNYEAETGRQEIQDIWVWFVQHKSREASINMNVDVGDDGKDEVREIRRPIGRDKAKDAMKKKGPRASGLSSMNDEALTRLMVSEMTTQNERAIEMQQEER